MRDKPHGQRRYALPLIYLPHMSMSSTFMPKMQM